MADDLAFLFDHPGRSRVTKAAPSGKAVVAGTVPHAAAGLPDHVDWRTLRQAHDQTSIPVSTLRKWAKKGKVRARLVRTEGRQLRLVAFGDVLERARSLDRTIAPVPPPPPEPVATSPLRSGRDAIEPVSTVRSASTASPEPGPPVAEPVAAAEPVAGVPEGSILVPLDAWDRLLGQLGNLHEAGQQLADARERAAKAETESEFLRERLREMRKRVEEAELALDSHAHHPPQSLPPSGPGMGTGWRRWRSRWLGY